MITMLVSDITCLAFLGMVCLIFLLAIDILVEWAWNHRISRFYAITGFIILFISLAIISLAVILLWV